MTTWCLPRHITSPLASINFYHFVQQLHTVIIRAIHLNLTGFQFTTTAHHVELNSLAENDETYIEFRRNEIRNYTDLSAQEFMFYLSTEGAPLLFVLDDNELLDINPEDFYLTRGPVRVRSINHTSNQDDYANLVDPLHIVIKNHHFGPDYDNVAIEVTRSDVEGVPSSTIEIIGSLFEHSSTNQEMCRFNNIQPSDTIIIRGSNFSRGSCAFYFGHPVEWDNSTVGTNGSVRIEDCRFEDNDASPSVAIYDVDANTANTSNSSNIVIHRNSMTITGSLFRGIGSLFRGATFPMLQSTR